MTRKSGLGRGLDALIPATERPAPSGVTEIAINLVERNPRQPRINFDQDDLAELAASIREHGVIQPLILTQAEAPGRYTLVAGERRLLAARLVGLSHVPAIVREVSEQGRLELALIENLQRTDLGPLETAEAYRQLVDDFSLSHDQIAERVGKSRVAVTNTLRLLKLADTVQAALGEGKISEGHARALLSLGSPQAQAAALQSILEQDLTVRQTESLVRKLSGDRPTVRLKPGPLPEVLALQERLQAALGTRVNLNRRKKGGTITIHYYSDEELGTLLDTLLRDEPGEEPPGLDYPVADDSNW